MKNLITIMIMLVVGLLAVGCETLTPEEKKALRDSVVGEYELKEDGNTFKVVYLENGVFELYTNGQKQGENKWTIVDGEIHFVTDSGNIQVAIINQDKSITQIVFIRDGKRTDIPKEEQLTWKKIY